MSIIDFISKKVWKHSENVDAEKRERKQLLLERLKQEIIRELGKHSRKTMEGVTTNSFGRSMTRLGMKRVRRHDTDGYIVKPTA